MYMSLTVIHEVICYFTVSHGQEVLYNGTYGSHYLYPFLNESLSC